MTRESMHQIFGLISILSASLFVVWWALLLIPMPAPDSATLLLDMVNHPTWVLINSLGSFATMLFVLVLVGLYMPYFEKLGKFGFIGFLLSFMGWLLYVWIQIEETIVWPVIAVYAPVLIDIQGPLFKDVVFSTTHLMMGILFMFGVILLGIAFLKVKLFPLYPVILFVLGACLFAIGGPVFVIRTIGVVLEATGLIWLGLEQRKTPRLSDPVL